MLNHMLFGYLATLLRAMHKERILKTVLTCNWSNKWWNRRAWAYQPREPTHANILNIFDEFSFIELVSLDIDNFFDKL